MKVHNVKCWPEYFVPLSLGIKAFDLRKDDRGYSIGDEVIFEEYKPGIGTYTGNITMLRINYILREFDGLMPGYCILGLTTDSRSSDVR